MKKSDFFDTASFHIEKAMLKKPMLEMHDHDAVEVYALLHGERDYFIEDAFYEMHDGDIVIIPPRVIHRAAGRGASRFLIYYKEEFLSRYFSPALSSLLLPDAPCVIRLSDAARERFYADLEVLLALYRNAQSEQSACLAGYLLSAMLFALREENTYTQESSSADDRLSQVIRYINENYAHIADIEEVAAQVYISKYHLCRIFKRRFGVSLVEHINRVRVRAACAMMREGRQALTDIALAAGFNSASYFCRVFKEEMGETPAAYRARASKQ